MFVLGVVPEYQCAVKRKEKKAQKDKDKPVSSTNGSPEIRIDQDPVITIIMSIFLYYICIPSLPLAKFAVPNYYILV